MGIAHGLIIRTVRYILFVLRSFLPPCIACREPLQISHLCSEGAITLNRVSLSTISEELLTLKFPVLLLHLADECCLVLS